MKSLNLKKLKKKGFSIIEAMLAISLSLFIAISVFVSLNFSLSSNSASNDQANALFLAKEGLEAIRNIRDQDFDTITNGTYGLTVSGGRWTLSGTSDNTGIFTRQIVISTVDDDTKRATVTISWQGKSISLNGDYTLWPKEVSNYTATKGGILVYGDGGTTTDSIKYRILNGNTGLWGTASSAADIDAGSSDRALINLRLYSSTTRDEKILISKHCAGSQMYIYAQVWNGTTWGNVLQLSTFAGTSGCPEGLIQDYDGAYMLSSGNFMAIFSDNTTNPKSRIWDGTSWSAQANTRNVTTSPKWIYVSAGPPGRNDIMMTVYDGGTDTRTGFYNGTAWATSITAHSTSGGSINNSQIDARWGRSAPDKLHIVFPQMASDTTFSARVFTADGAGSGTWGGTIVNSSTLPGGWVSLISDPRPGGTSVMVCGRLSVSSTYTIYCSRSSTAPGWTLPTNPTIASGLSNTGDQLSFDFRYEPNDGAEGLVVYTDGTNTPKYKTYTTTNNTFDAASTSMQTLNGNGLSVKMRPAPDNNDIMILLGDNNNDFYTVIWSGAVNQVHTTPSGKAFSTQGTNGFRNDSFYYDFIWDTYP